MRFLMLAAGYPPLRSAGLETGCQRLAHALGRRGHEVLILTQAARGKPPVEAESEGVEVHRVLKPLALGPLWGISFMFQVRHWMHRLSPRWDFALCHKLALHSMVASEVCRKLGRPSASLLVNAGLFSDIRVLRDHKGGSLLLRRALATDGFFALSGVSKAELEAHGIAPERIHPFRYMVDIDRFRPSGDPGDHFLFIGRFHAQKNLPLLIEAFARAHATDSSVRLRLIGRGDEAERVRALVEASPARSAITIEDWTNDPAAAYQRAAAVVSSSDAEGLSNVSVEAAACGAPTILTRVSGVAEVLFPGHDSAPEPAPATFAQGVGGLMVPTRDAEALAAAMLRLHRDPSLRRQLAAEARANALERFSEPVCVELFLRGAEAIIQGHRR